MSATHIAARVSLCASHFALEPSARRSAKRVFECPWCGVPDVLTSAEHRSAIQEKLEGEKAKRRNAAFAEQKAGLTKVRDLVEHYGWALHWPAVEACLSAVATIRLANPGASLALFLVGASGEGKSTVLYFFGVPDEAQLAYSRSETRLPVEQQDGITDAAWLPHTGDGVTAEQNEERALYAVVKDRVLLTPELSQMLRGGAEYEQTNRFSGLASVLDGEGRRTVSGMHGSLGTKGNFPFVWLGGTTPLQERTWQKMALLGTRLLFIQADPDAALHGPEAREYGTARSAIRSAVFPLVEMLCKEPRSIQAKQWPECPKEIYRVIERLAETVALGQRFVVDNIPEGPSANHFIQRLVVLASGRALLYGRNEIDETDLPMLVRISKSSVFRRRGQILSLLTNDEKRPLLLTDLAVRIGVSVNTVRTELQSLQSVEVVTLALPSDETRSAGRPEASWTLTESAWAKLERKRR